MQGEGVAYRGRLLVELETKLDTQPTKLVENVLSDDIIRIQVSIGCSLLQKNQQQQQSKQTCYEGMNNGGE